MHFLIILGLLALAMVLLSVRVILYKNGRFHSEHVSQNEHLRKHNVHCINTQDWEARHPDKNKIDTKQL